MAKDHILIVAEGCEGCAEAEAKFKNDPRIRVVDMMKDGLAADIVRSLDIIKLPTVVEHDTETNKACVLDDNFKRHCATVLREA